MPEGTRPGSRSANASHGTLNRYVLGKCRCRECRAAACCYNKRLRYEKTQGQQRLVDAEPLRRHVERLQQQGMSFRAIALTAGWASPNALTSALNSKRVRPGTAARILSIQPASDTRPTSYTPATGSARRLQALAAIGHASRTIAHALGHRDHSVVLRIQSGKATSIRRGTADSIAALYDTLWNQEGTSPRARAIAQARGWLPPMAWDDDTIDDPATQPDPAAVRARHRTTHLSVDDALELLRWGYTREQAAERLGVTRDTIDKALSRTNRSSQESRTTRKTA